MTGLADRLRAFVVDALERLHATHLPGFRIPGVFAGFEVGTDVRADLAFTLGLLGAGGVDSVAGATIEDQLRVVLGPTAGRRTHTFFSYRVAETVGRYGPFAGNRLLAPMTEDQRQEIALACDSTSYLPLLDAGLPRNYAAVLGRCEAARAAIGLPVDPTVLDDLVRRTLALLTANPGGYLDDSPAGAGRFDIYTADIYLFTEPLAERLGPAWAAGAAGALALVEAVVARNGAGITWGRSIGALAACLTIELAGLAARHGLADAAPWMARAEAAFRDLRGWFPGGLINAHQYRSTFAYRGPARRLQMTLDCLGKLADAANALDGVQDGVEPRAVAASDRDVIVWFDQARRAGVWSYRTSELAAVVPLVGGSLADYLPAPRNPGMFEVPVDSPLVTGVPAAFFKSVCYAPAGLPAAVAHVPGGIDVHHHGWVEAGHMDVPADRPVLAGGRWASYRAEGRTLRVSEELRFEKAPHALSLQIAETAGRPLRVEFESDVDAATTTIDTAGIKEYRSFWAELPVVHQIDLAPAEHVRLNWAVTPKLRVASTAFGHHYDSSLYNPIVARVFEGPVPSAVYRGDGTRLRDWDQLHMHWPEWTMPPDAGRHEAFIRVLRDADIRIVWTQHNLRPHDGDGRWDPVYRTWAAAADLVIHHTRWGLAKALSTYDYGAHTRHRVVPHGHFGNLMAELGSVDRAAVERDLGWRPGVLRLGIVGAPRPPKQVALAMEAVVAARRDDIELVVLSLRPDDPVPGDPRIVGRIYENLPRQEYNRRLAAIDVLVLPFEEGDMLATGTVGDAIGAGLPSLISDWRFLGEYLGDAAIPYGRTAEDLARCIDALDDAQLEFARAGARAKQADYDWVRVAAAHADVLEELGTLKV